MTSSDSVLMRSTSELALFEGGQCCVAPARGVGFLVPKVDRALVRRLCELREPTPIATVLEEQPKAAQPRAAAVLERMWHAGYLELSLPIDRKSAGPWFHHIELDTDAGDGLPSDLDQLPPSRISIVLHCPSITRGLEWLASQLGEGNGQFRRICLAVDDVECTPDEAAELSAHTIGVRLRWDPAWTKPPNRPAGLQRLQEAWVRIQASVELSDPPADGAAAARVLLQCGVSEVRLGVPAACSDEERLVALTTFRRVIPASELADGPSELTATGWEGSTDVRPARAADVRFMLESTRHLETSCTNPQTSVLQDHLYPPELTASVADVLNELGCREIIDVCGGQGPLAVRLSGLLDAPFRITVCDRDPFAVALGRSHVAEHGTAGVEFRRCLAEATPFPDSSVDAVIIAGSFDFFLSSGTAGVLTHEVRRVLAPGGVLVVLHPLGWVAHGSGAPLGPPQAVANALRSGGFEVADRARLGAFPTGPAALSPEVARQSAQPHLRFHPNYLLMSHPLFAPSWTGGPPVEDSAVRSTDIPIHQHLSLALLVGTPAR